MVCDSCGGRRKFLSMFEGFELCDNCKGEWSLVEEVLE